MLGASDPTVTTALIVAISTIVVATVTAVPATMAAVAARRTHRAVGTPNGNGNVVEMSEKTLGNTTESLGWQRHHGALDGLNMHRVDTRLARVEEAVGLERGEPLETEGYAQEMHLDGE